MRLQAELLRWGQGSQGEAVTEPSADLLISPPIAELRPGERQVFRVALRGARPAPEELAYRLILEDIAEPVLAAGDSGSMVNFRMRYDLPVLVAPVGKVVNALHWKPCSPEAASMPAKPAAAEACVHLSNAGNRRVKIQTLMLTGDGWQQVLSLKNGENMLSGTQRDWRVPLQPGQSGPLRGVEVKTTGGETLQAQAGGV